MNDQITEEKIQDDAEYQAEFIILSSATTTYTQITDDILTETICQPSSYEDRIRLFVWLRLLELEKTKVNKQDWSSKRDKMFGRIRTKISEISDCLLLATPKETKVSPIFNRRLEVLKSWLLKQEFFKGDEITILPKIFTYNKIHIALNQASLDTTLFDLSLSSFTRHFWLKQKIVKLTCGR